MMQKTLICRSEEEAWKPIPGFDGIYEASSLGRIRLIEIPEDKYNEHRSWKPTIMKQHLDIKKNGKRTDCTVALSKDKKKHRFLVSRLVAMSFYGVPSPGMTVNHKNGITTDNRACNLEWVTQAENNRHARETGLCASRETPVMLIDNFINDYRFARMSDASKFLGRGDKYVAHLLYKGKYNATSKEGVVYRIARLSKQERLPT